jgi:hypothetical protein
MTAKNQFDSVTEMLADSGERFFRNLELSAGNLDTLGPKIKISRHFVLRASGDALEEAVLFYAKSSPSVQVLRVESPLKGRSYEIFWKP